MGVEDDHRASIEARCIRRRSIASDVELDTTTRSSADRRQRAAHTQRLLHRCLEDGPRLGFQASVVRSGAQTQRAMNFVGQVSDREVGHACFLGVNID
jgi:hypothetical protein